ncbi:MAG: alpha/beta fold hydrolase [Gemmatimonadetes bacterium]|nr:alpha/beta fold hydrolase [Gemmatimonadota bacterium]
MVRLCQPLGCLALAALVGRDSADSVLDAAIAGAKQAPPATLISREALLARARYRDVTLSPDGLYLAYLEESDGRIQAKRMTLADSSVKLIMADAAGTRLVWSADGTRLWMSDAVGLAVHLPARDMSRRVYKWDATRHQRLHGIDRFATDAVVISERIARGNQAEYRYLLVTDHGSETLLYTASHAQQRIALDATRHAAYSAGYEGDSYRPVIRRHVAGGTEIVHHCPTLSRCLPTHVDAASARLHLLSMDDSGLRVLMQYDPRSKQTSAVLRDPDALADATHVIPGDDRLPIVAAAFEAARVRWTSPDAATRRWLDAVQARWPDANLHLQASRDGQRWLVEVAASDAVHPRRFIVDRPRSRPRAVLVEPAGPDARVLSVAHAFDWKARDGMTLHGYLHLVPGRDPSQTPLVALIHGGPFSRDRADYSALAQLLVNRGMAVFRPNFRGSTGYGRNYVLASDGDFGNGRVLADIVEGMDYLLARGIGDRTRQAIIGHSFGGYASLLAITHHPDRFRLAVAAAAPTELAFSTQWVANNSSSALPEDAPPAARFFADFGMPIARPDWLAKMKAQSPHHGVEALRTALTMWAGARDDRVPIKAVSDYATRAQQAGHTPTLLIDPSAGHSPESPQSQQALLYSIEYAAARAFSTPMQAADPTLARFVKSITKLEGAPR